MNYYKLIIINAQKEKKKKKDLWPEGTKKRHMSSQNSLLLTTTIMITDRQCQGNKKTRCIVALIAERRKGKTVKFDASMAVTLRLPSSGMWHHTD